MEEKYKIHSFYILLILISAIVCLISIEWAKIPGLVDYITFALTLSSLILAVLAIIYSIHSNSSISISLIDISKSALDVTKASNEIMRSNDELKSELSHLPLAIKDVGERVGETKAIVEDIVLDKKRGLDINLEQDSSTIRGIGSDLIDRFMKNSSISGMEALYAVVLSNKTNTSLEFEELFTDTDRFSGSDDYFFAYAHCAASLGFYSYKYDGQGRMIVNNVNEYLLNNIDKLVEEKLVDSSEELFKDNDQKETTLAGWRLDIDRINEYFRYKKT